MVEWFFIGELSKIERYKPLFISSESVRINIHQNEGRYKVEFFISTVLFIVRIAIDLGFSFCNMPCGKLI